MIKIEILYPEVCNLYGDLFNMNYLEQTLPDAVIYRTSLNAPPRFLSEDINFIYMGPCPEKEQELIIRKLRPYTNRIRDLIEKDTVFLFTGNAFEIFGSYIETDEIKKIPCLGIYEGYSIRRMMHRHNSVFLGTISTDTGKDIEVIGFKSQFTHTYADNSKGYCFKKVRGYGINPESDFEGIRIRNFFGTYLIGPLLILNPYLTKYLLSLAGAGQVSLKFEKEAIDAYQVRLEEFHDLKRTFDQ